MKVKLLDIWNSGQYVDKLIETGSTSSAKDNYLLAKLTKVLSKEIDDIDQQRKVLIKNLLHVDESGKIPETTTKEEKEEFSKQFQALLATEIDVPLFKIDLSTLEGRKLTTRDFMLLDFLITEPVVDK
jgi:hypothetical protein